MVVAKLPTIRKSPGKLVFEVENTSFAVGSTMDLLKKTPGIIVTGENSNGIILNAAAYTHTSVGIADAVKSIDCKVIEVHISNTYSREEFRHNSYLSPVVDGIIIGFGLKSYRLAIDSIIKDE